MIHVLLKEQHAVVLHSIQKKSERAVMESVAVRAEKEKT
jgi:phage-related protein